MSTGRHLDHRLPMLLELAQNEGYNATPMPDIRLLRSNRPLTRTPVLKQLVAEHSRSQFAQAGLKVLEVELVKRKIPYVKYGGLKFLEAAHVKDLLGVLRWADGTPGG